MTSSNGCSGTSATSSRENAAGASSAGRTQGRSPSSLARPAGGASTFGAYLELLAKEDRAGRKPPPAQGLRADAPPIGADGGASETKAQVRAEEERCESETDGDGAPPAPYGAAVGQDTTLDPMMQVLGALAPRGPASSVTARPESAEPPQARTSIEQLMVKLVRRVAWSGNGRHGVARLELGAGVLEGATLTIHADDGVVRVALDLPPGVDRAAWKARIGERLGLRGLHVEAIDVA